MFIELCVYNEDNERELEYKVNLFLVMIDFFVLFLRYVVYIRWKLSLLNYVREDLLVKKYFILVKR